MKLFALALLLSVSSCITITDPFQSGEDVAPPPPDEKVVAPEFDLSEYERVELEPEAPEPPKPDSGSGMGAGTGAVFSEGAATEVDEIGGATSAAPDPPVEEDIPDQPQEPVPAPQSAAPSFDPFQYTHRVVIGRSVGTAVCIHSDGQSSYLVTAYHLVSQSGLSSPVPVMVVDGTEYRGRVLNTSRRADDGITTLSFPVSLPSCEINPSLLTYFDTLQFAGRTSAPKVQEGYLSDEETLSIDPTSGTGVGDGDSGGGVFRDGQLVGVLRGRNPNLPRVAYFTPLFNAVSILRGFMDVAPATSGTPMEEAIEAGLPVTSRDGAHFWEFEGMTWSTTDALVDGEVFEHSDAAFVYFDGRMYRDALFFFTATWCGPCKVAHTDVLPHLPQGMVVEVDADKHSAMVRRLQVSSLPTYVRFENGRETGRRVGATLAQVQELLN